MSAGDGGAAFPTSIEVTSEGQTVQLPHPGMSLRDWFAGQAIGVVVPHLILTMTTRFTEKQMAELAYAVADAMLAARDSERGRGG